jgi:hypothetical protein
MSVSNKTYKLQLKSWEMDRNNLYILVILFI